MKLSPRQEQVIGLIANGRIDKEIADELQIGKSTVSKYIAGIFKRLNARTRAQAVGNWLRNHN